MTLGFSQQINGKPNYFIEKIWKGLIENKIKNKVQMGYYLGQHNDKFGKFWDISPEEILFNDLDSKLHTIRHPRRTKTGEKADKQWKAGDKIHPAINNRSPNYFQFAPVIECLSVQRIDIKHLSLEPGGEIKPIVWIDGYLFYDPATGFDNGIEKLAVNDGFDSVQDFFDYFRDGVEDGSLIHWSPLKY